MPKKITTLYMYNDLGTAIYPNVVDENIPDTIMRVDDLGTELSKLTEYTFLAPVTIGASGKEQSFYLYGSATVSGTLDVEGKATFGGDAEVDGKLQINSASDLVIKDGTTFAEADYDALKSYVDTFKKSFFASVAVERYSACECEGVSGNSSARALPSPWPDSTEITDWANCYYGCEIRNQPDSGGSNLDLVTPVLGTNANVARLIQRSHFSVDSIWSHKLYVRGTTLNGRVAFEDFSHKLNLTEISPYEGYDVKFIGNCNSTFAGQSTLVTIGAFDFSGATHLGGLFSLCSALKEIHCTHFKVSFGVSASIQFEESDLVEIISNLDTVSTAQTLTMGSTNLAKLTQDEILVATGKGWTLA